MERSKFGKFLDNVAIGVLIFFLAYLTAKKYIKSKLTCLVISLLLMSIFIYFIFKIQNKKYAKLGLKKQEQKQIESLLYFLKSQTKVKQNATIKHIFEEQFKMYKNQFFILKNQVAILNRISKNQADEEDVFFIISHSEFLIKNDIKEVSILCACYDKNINQSLLKNSNFNIIFLTPEIFYSIAKNHNYNLPEIEKTQNLRKTSKIRIIFAKNNAKHFFRVAILLYIFSMIIPFSKHYIYFATLSLALSTLIFLFGKGEEKPTTNYRILEDKTTQNNIDNNA